MERDVSDINGTTYMLEMFQRNAMIIFNQENFLNKNPRYGTRFDEDALRNTFEQFRFVVTVHKDLEKATLFAELQKFSAQNFEECGCVCVAVLTHGSDYGFLEAFDASYSERELFACFDATKNPSLAGKPIIFLIQACRGTRLASSVHVPGSEGRPAIEVDADIRRAAGYFLPTESDLIIFHSCFFGRASVRETNNGSWFIRTTCKQINQHASHEHLETIFRRVRNIIALEKEHQRAKQMPVMTSTLLRKLYLKMNGESGLERERVEISKEPRFAACSNCSPRLIETYFESTTIVRGMSRQVQYCNTIVARHPIDMSQVIDLYRTQEHVHSYKYMNPNTPTTEHGVLVVSGGWQLPLYQIADIRRHHLLPQSEPEFEKNINEYMKLMGRLNDDDDIGYLLHHSLGGSSRNINLIPMARNVLQRPIVATDNHIPVINKSILPRSFWKSNEDWIRRFLNTYPNGRVAWRVAVQYEEGVITNPENFINYRPMSFSLQYTAHTQQHDDTNCHYISPQTTFCNDNSNDSCGNELPPFDLVPNGPEGRFGSVMSRGVWPSAHQLSFPYTIQGRTFFYGQSLTDGRLWFIRELLPYGQMGERISRGYWEIDYQLVFPFVINGRQFFYGHNHITKLWVIQELLPDGKMGEETSSGQWSKTHQVAFPFSINGAHYFLGQSIEGDWFIRELLPGGKTGKETCSGTWKVLYDIVFPYEINAMQYCYLHNHSQKAWSVWQLLPGGQMGKQTSYGGWESAHRVSVPYSINGKPFFFGQKVENGKWYIAELLPDGKMGYDITFGEWRDQYSVAFTYSLNGGQYIYGHSFETRSWFIKELL